MIALSGRVVPANARMVAARLSALFERDVEIVARLNDAQRRLREANERLWFGLAPDAFGVVYDGAAAAAVGTSPIAALMSDARRAADAMPTPRCWRAPAGPLGDPCCGDGRWGASAPRRPLAWRTCSAPRWEREPMTGSQHKIGPRYLERQAIVYLRQSTPRQVRENFRSTELQYGLAEEAVKLGWQPEQILTVDGDLGVSSTRDSEARDSYKEPSAASASAR